MKTRDSGSEGKWTKERRRGDTRLSPLGMIVDPEIYQSCSRGNAVPSTNNGERGGGGGNGEQRRRRRRREWMTEEEEEEEEGQKGMENRE
ncbi:hypothetical protein Pmani_027790 [Petrolisthes manimaculis]|uniref:Uncharacterized protein n=1 Tax=Petrolisthes manimaculis TaxID=1843537 RepID=A0AAE1P1Z0_9EUCA|nr:hypothetical protein Pmani_027790 [Petrolisthes manimaculis]